MLRFGRRQARGPLRADGEGGEPPPKGRHLLGPAAAGWAGPYPAAQQEADLGREEPLRLHGGDPLALGHAGHQAGPPRLAVRPGPAHQPAAGPHLPEAGENSGAARRGAAARAAGRGGREAAAGGHLHLGPGQRRAGGGEGAAGAVPPAGLRPRHAPHTRAERQAEEPPAVSAQEEHDVTWGGGGGVGCMRQKTAEPVKDHDGSKANLITGMWKYVGLCFFKDVFLFTLCCDKKMHKFSSLDC